MNAKKILIAASTIAVATAALTVSLSAVAEDQRESRRGERPDAVARPAPQPATVRHADFPRRGQAQRAVVERPDFRHRAPTVHQQPTVVQRPVVVHRPVIVQRPVVIERPVHVHRTVIVERPAPVYYPAPRPVHVVHAAPRDYYHEPEPYRDDDANPAGAIAGAVIGGVIGSQVGDGDSRGITILIGAILGGLIGNGL